MNLPPVLVALAVVQLVVKLLLLNWYRGEYTDAILQLTLFENDSTFFAPLFPALAKMTEFVAKDPIYAGRLVSILASTLTLIPIFFIGRRIWSEPAGLLACVCYSVSAIHWRWSVRAMTDPLFALFFLMALLAFVQSFLGRDKMQLWYCLFWTGCTILTRYQGIVLIPLIVFGWIRSRRSSCSSLFMIGGVVPWVFLIWWFFERGFGHTGQFQERAVGGVGNVLMAYLTMAEGFIAYLPYALTYPLFVVMVIGIVKGMALPKARFFGFLTLYLFIPWLVIHSAF
nr:glycosyltransferase family 39 protein [bacterium]